MRKKMVPRRTIGITRGFAVLACAVLYAQVAVQPRSRPAAPEPVKPSANLRIDTNLVLVPVSVCDPMNRPVTGLEKDNFKLLDDKVEQTITHFAMDDEAVAVGLVFDVSGSMGSKLRMSRMAAAQFAT